ncbi:MAG: L-aspartate oxidase [Actinobacteria bacterium]|uniref:L-aspartate oxidase n=1 Tax=freshwater metagenome TaxID=449393 RepID=A0A6J6XIY4_9ZZZZ|nr:L-aspartate oxidase [Actinomycetota bacterium]
MLPLALDAPAVTWTRDVDVVVLGSGAAGLAAALAVRPLRSVLLVTKDTLDAGATAWAQGGLAAVLDPQDSLEAHVSDTLEAGAGLCDEMTVRELVAEAPDAIRYLMTLGAAFDESGDGSPSLTREGGHSANRIVHSHGDQSGREVQRTLDQRALAAGVELLDRAFALDIVMGTNSSGKAQAAGVRVARIDGNGMPLSVGLVTARAVVVATGGYGQVFASTSNPPAVTGDGLAAALRAGAEAADLEFIQFHPTVLYTGPDALGQQPLISEAVRGEGAILYDALGERVMVGVHPLEDLAPRDVVAAAISRRMAESPGGVDDHVFLDATHLGTSFETRFPSITEACRANGIDPVTQRIPVAPAAHYACGGIRADLDGCTGIAGLYAVGEVACTGLHGANRLASNSVTEGLVAGTRLGRNLAWRLPEHVEPVDAPDSPSGLLGAGHRGLLRAEMSRHVGVMRSESGLRSCLEALAELSSEVSVGTTASRRSWEATNLLTVATAVVVAALARTESRGCHRRSDWPAPRDEWRRHLGVYLNGSGLHLDGIPGAASAPGSERV